MNPAGSCAVHRAWLRWRAQSAPQAPGATWRSFFIRACAFKMECIFIQATPGANATLTRSTVPLLVYGCHEHLLALHFVHALARGLKPLV